MGSAFLIATAQAATYRWTGDDGQTMYSQIPPDDGRPYTVIGAPPPPADQSGQQSQLDQLRQSQADAVEDKELADEKAAEDKRKQAALAHNCDVARENIAALEGSPRRLYRQPDGTTRRLTPEERDARLAEARDYLTKHCP